MQADVISSNEPLMDTLAAALYFGKSRKTIERYARAGKLPRYWKFNRWYFLKNDLDAWLRGALSSDCQSVREN